MSLLRCAGKPDQTSLAGELQDQSTPSGTAGFFLRLYTAQNVFFFLLLIGTKIGRLTYRFFVRALLLLLS